MVVLWIIFGLSYLSMTLNFLGRGYKKVQHSEVIHSMHSSLAHISEPFLHRTPKPKITFEASDTEEDEKSNVETGLQMIQPSHLHPSNSCSSFCSVCTDSRAHHSHHQHSHRSKSNTSVLPYIT